MTTPDDQRPPREIERDGFVARPARDADLPGMARVIAAAFDRWPPVETDASPLDHLRWKTSAPDTPPGIHTVVEHDGQIVAAKLRWLGRALLYGEEHVVDVGADFAVDPAYRGRGIGRLVNDFEDTGKRPRGTLSFEPSPHDEAVLHMHHAGVRLPLAIWRRPIGLRSLLGTIRRADAPLRAVTATVRGLASHRSSGAAGQPPVVPLDRFDQRTDALWEAGRGSFDFQRVRDAAWMNWRYLDPRGGRRICLGIFDADRALAYAVLRQNRDALELSDLLIDPAEPEAGTSLLREVVTTATERDLRAVTGWLPPAHPYEPLLSQAGFVRLRAQIPADHKPPRGGEWPGVTTEFARPGLRRHTVLGDFDFA